MNSENTKTSNPHRLLLNPLDKINIKRSDKSAFTMHRKKLKSHAKIMNLKYQLQREMKFELPDGSCFVSDIQNYFEYI